VVTPSSGAAAVSSTAGAGRSGAAATSTTSRAGAGTGGLAAIGGTRATAGASSTAGASVPAGSSGTGTSTAGTPATAAGSSGAAGKLSAGTGGVAGTAAGGPANDRCQIGVYDGTPPKALTLKGNTFAHDPTLIEADGVYYRFWTGDYIPSATSTDLLTWRDGPTVYPKSYPAWSRDWLAGVSGQTFNFPWAPDASFFSGKYHIYSSFSAKFGDNISCITHLTTGNIASEPWTDHGAVICTKGSEKYNAIDADVGLDDAGKAYLAFGSFWDGIMAFPLDENGSRVGTELTRLAWAKEIEAPVLFHRCGYYYLFVTWGLCCPGQGRTVDQLTYRVAVGRSEHILGPYVDKAGVALVDGGGTLMVHGDDTFAAAGHSDVLVAQDRIYHLYHAYRRPRGDAELRIVEMPFDQDGWPVPAAGP